MAEETNLNGEVESRFRGSTLQMSRSVGQLLFTYLPGRVVDWEDGTAIVQLRNVRLARVWSDRESRLVLREVAEYLEGWQAKGGTVHPAFADPTSTQARFTVGEPAAITASPLQGAMVCRACGRLVFGSLANLQKRKFLCPSCNRHTLRQFGQVLIHGCGALVPIAEFMPWLKQEDGVYQLSQLPIRCKTCGKDAVLEVPARSERARDMKVICRRCKSEAASRLVARCPECSKEFAGKTATDGAETENDEGKPTVVARVAMRLVNSRANEAYYPHTISLLRLDKPQLANHEDDETRMLFRMLPQGALSRAGAFGSIDTLQALTEHLRDATLKGDSAEVARLRAEIVRAASTPPPSAPAIPAVTMDGVAPDIVKAIEESLVFRTAVTSRSIEEVLRHSQGATAMLLSDIARRQTTLGISRIALVDDLPVISAAFGFTRRSADPTYDEEALNAHGLPTQLRPFYALDEGAARSMDRVDLKGTIPILAKEGEHEGIFIGLSASQVGNWLERNGVRIPAGYGSPLERLLLNLERVDRYYDDVEKLPLRRMVYGLVHTLSHVSMRIVSKLAGFERTSLSEYIFLPLLGTVVYANGSAVKLGGMETVIRDRLLEFLDGLESEGMSCLYDPDCLDRKGACHGCIHSPEISCRAFNHGLFRAFLSGGHAPWEPASTDKDIVGYWE